jgi:hypothetical protein
VSTTSTGDAGDALNSAISGTLSNGKRFSASNNDNDNNWFVNCANKAGGGWWFDNCCYCCLNGDLAATYYYWHSLVDNGISDPWALKVSRMMVVAV